MRVSQVWRQIAVSTRLVFDHEKHFIDLARARMHLATSGNQPLDVRIKAPIHVDDMVPITKLLQEHVSRLHMLDIRVPTYEIAATLVSSIGAGKSAPLLEQLNVVVEQELSEPVPVFSAFPNAFHPCPRLTHLTLPGMPLPPSTIPHFFGLTSLTVDAIPFYYDIDVDKILDILGCTKHLQHFTYKGTDVFSYSSTSNLDHPGIVSMPHLVSADVSAPGCGLDILRALDAPLLSDVRFDAWRDERFAEEWVESLTAPISASLRRISERSPKVSRLELRSTRMLSPLDDYEWLMSDNAFPRLEVLRLDATDITDKALRAGAGGMKALKRLELRACDVSGDEVLRFVEGRGKGFGLLIDACPGVKPGDIARLSKNVRVESNQ